MLWNTNWYFLKEMNTFIKQARIILIKSVSKDMYNVKSFF